MVERQVSPAKRTVTYTMDADEAKAIVAWFRKATGSMIESPPVQVQTFIEPLFAVAESREYGGH
jgi:hypothetical protein